MVSAQPRLITQVTGDLTHVGFWAANVFVDHYSNYCCTHLMRGTSDEETFWEKEAYEHLVSTHRARVCAYRADNRRFTDPQFEDRVQTCGQHISHCWVVSHHQSAIIESRIK